MDWRLCTSALFSLQACSLGLGGVERDGWRCSAAADADRLLAWARGQRGSRTTALTGCRRLWRGRGCPADSSLWLCLRRASSRRLGPGLSVWALSTAAGVSFLWQPSPHPAHSTALGSTRPAGSEDMGRWTVRKELGLQLLAPGHGPPRRGHSMCLLSCARGSFWAPKPEAMISVMLEDGGPCLSTRLRGDRNGDESQGPSRQPGGEPPCQDAGRSQGLLGPPAHQV